MSFLTVTRRLMTSLGGCSRSDATGDDKAEAGQSGVECAGPPDLQGGTKPPSGKVASARRLSQSEISMVGAYSGGGCGDKGCRDVGCRRPESVRQLATHLEFLAFDGCRKPASMRQLATHVESHGSNYRVSFTGSMRCGPEADLPSYANSDTFPLDVLNVLISRSGSADQFFMPTMSKSLGETCENRPSRVCSPDGLVERFCDKQKHVVLFAMSNQAISGAPRRTTQRLHTAQVGMIGFTMVLRYFLIFGVDEFTNIVRDSCGNLASRVCSVQGCFDAKHSAHDRSGSGGRRE